MTALIVLAHAPLASSLAAVAKHVYPECGGIVTAIDAAPQADISTIEDNLRTLIKSLGQQDVLVLVDVVGASPCNAAARLHDLPNVALVAGLSVPMLWRTICYCHEPLDALIKRAFDGGVAGVQQIFRPHPSQSTEQKTTP